MSQVNIRKDILQKVGLVTEIPNSVITDFGFFKNIDGSEVGKNKWRMKIRFPQRSGQWENILLALFGICHYKNHPHKHSESKNVK